MKPYSEACDQNREPILGVITKAFADCKHVLEIGSGTGQHAVFFASKLPHLNWQTSDVSENLAGINLWIDDFPSENIRRPLTIDVSTRPWPLARSYDAVFSANTTHIMSWSNVERFFAGIAATLRVGGTFCLYGPFNYDNRFTSESNARFDQWLKNRDPNSGIRDFEALNKLATQNNLILADDIELPANNRILIWHKM